MGKNKDTAENFWQEYEEKTGEKILARCLGQYISGWEEFGDFRIWGLVIFTSGGFRFHHFSQQSWLLSLVRTEAPKEKTIFIPNEKILSSKLIKESNWWKRTFSSFWQRFLIQYLDNNGNEKQLSLDLDTKSGDLKSKDLDHLMVTERAATAAPNSEACSTGAIE